MTALTASSPARSLSRPTTVEAMALRLAASVYHRVERRIEQRTARPPFQPRRQLGDALGVGIE